MAFNKVLIIADDLTGANDTAIQFVEQGLSALVLTHTKVLQRPESRAVNFDKYDVIAINTNSRAMNRNEAYQTVRRVVAKLKESGFKGLYYKKIDSVLRGNPGAELAAMMDELGISPAIVAPSFPANRSTLEHGILRSGKGEESGSVDALKVFAESMKAPVENITIEEIRKGADSAAQYLLEREAAGAKVFVADALTSGDLELVYRMARSLDKPLILAGAAGLAIHLARDLALPAKAEARPISGSLWPVLVVAGTRQGETAAQVSALAKSFSVPVIRFATSRIAENRSEEAVAATFEEAGKCVKAEAPVCIVAVDSMFNAKIPAGKVDRACKPNDTLSFAIASNLGALTAKLLGSFHFPVTITTGGDTSLEVCKRLGSVGIEPIAEICPGIPIGSIVGGPYQGRMIITKSGRFGSVNALVEIMNYLNNLSSARKEKEQVA